MTLSDITTGKEYTINEKKNGIKEIVANEGFWITDKVIYEGSGFFKRLRTKKVDDFGTITDEQKETAEQLIKEMLDKQIMSLESEE